MDAIRTVMTILRKNAKYSYRERHPIADPSQRVYMEYLGKPSVAGSPCVSFGLAGGSLGPPVPLLCSKFFSTTLHLYVNG